MNLVLSSKATGSGQKMAKTKVVQKSACGIRGVKVKDTIDKNLLHVFISNRAQSCFIVA